ncbi:MAG TPA: hypothetical protein VIY73_00505, partial [Polyangiaceae bacterium]
MMAPALVAGAMLAAAPAHASPLVEAMGAVGGNAGDQGVVTGPGAASTYFNPALLADAPDEVGLGFAVISEQLGVTLEGRTPGADVPLVVGGRGVTSKGLPLPADIVPTQWLNNGSSSGFAARPRQAQGSSGQTRTYLTLGLTKAIVHDRLTFGLYAV